MPLFNKPEDLIGMSKEDFTAKMAKLDTAASKEDITAVKTEVTGALSEMKALIEGLKPKAADPDPNDPENDPAVQSLLSPDKFVDDKMKPLRESELSTRAMVQEMKARNNPQFAPYFQKFGADLVNAANVFPVEQRASEGFWSWHIMTFTGGQVMQGKLKTDYPALLGTSTVGVGDGGDVKDPNMGLNPAVSKWLTDHNVPIEGAARAAKLIDNGEHVTLDAYKKVQVANA